MEFKKYSYPTGQVNLELAIKEQEVEEDNIILLLQLQE